MITYVFLTNVITYLIANIWNLNYCVTLSNNSFFMHKQINILLICFRISYILKYQFVYPVYKV